MSTFPVAHLSICSHLRQHGVGFQNDFLQNCHMWVRALPENQGLPESMFGALEACVTALKPITPAQLQSCVETVKASAPIIPIIPLNLMGALGDFAERFKEDMVVLTVDDVVPLTFSVYQDMNSKEYAVFSSTDMFTPEFQKVAGPYSNRSGAQAELERLNQVKVNGGSDAGSAKKKVWPWVLAGVSVLGLGMGTIALTVAAVVLTRKKKKGKRRKKR